MKSISMTYVTNSSTLTCIVIVRKDIDLPTYEEIKDELTKSFDKFFRNYPEDFKEEIKLKLRDMYDFMRHEITTSKDEYVMFDIRAIEGGSLIDQDSPAVYALAFVVHQVLAKCGYIYEYERH